MIIESYMDKSLRKSKTKLNPVYDINFYHKQIKYSCVAKELNAKFIILPNEEAFDENGNVLEQWDNPSKH